MRHVRLLPIAVLVALFAACGAGDVTGPGVEDGTNTYGSGGYTAPSSPSFEGGNTYGSGY